MELSLANDMKKLEANTQTLHGIYEEAIRLPHTLSTACGLLKGTSAMLGLYEDCISQKDYDTATYYCARCVPYLNEAHTIVDAYIASIEDKVPDDDPTLASLYEIVDTIHVMYNEVYAHGSECGYLAVKGDA